MSRVTEIWLFQTQEWLFHWKLLDESGYFCEWEFINIWDWKYDVTFSWKMWTKICGNDFEYNIWPSKNGKRMFSNRRGDREIVWEWKYINWLFNWKWKYKELWEEMNVYYEWNFVNWRIEWYWKKTIVWKFWDWIYAKEIIKWEFKNWEPCWYCTYLSRNEYLLAPFREWKIEWVFEWNYLKNFWKIIDRENWAVYIWETQLNFPHWSWRITYRDWDSFEWIFENWILKICNNLITSDVRGPIWWEMDGVDYDGFKVRYLWVKEYV